MVDGMSTNEIERAVASASRSPSWRSRWAGSCARSCRL